MDLLPEAKTSITFYVNGREVRVDRPDPEMTLLHFLRRELHLTGTKLGCAEGGCGACTVMVSKYEEGAVRHISVNACLAPLCSVDGMAVTTVEGIGSTRTGLHPCQERIAKAHGSQCGFCTPGFVMSMYTLLRNNQAPSEEEVETAFEGNLCRCTGYRPILEGYKTFAKDYCCGGGKDGRCCQETPNQEGTIKGPSVLFDASQFSPLDPTQEPIFPAALKLTGPPKPLAISGPRVQWYRPATLGQLLALRERFPHHAERNKPQNRIVVGNSEIGVETKFKGAFYEVLICPSHVPELNRMEEREEGLLVGAAVSLSSMATKLREMVDKLPEFRTRTFSALLEMLRWFAGQQIRNTSAVGGNICNASPISDLIPTLMASGAKLTLASRSSQRNIVMDSSFFRGYKKTCLSPDEVLVSILIPFTSQHEYVYSYKQSRRREDDLAIVNAGLRVVMVPGEEGEGEGEGEGWTIGECALAYGGMSYVTVMATETQKALIGKPWNEATLLEATDLLSKELQLSPAAPGGMPEYRKSLVTSFFFKFYLTVAGQLSAQPLPREVQCATQLYHRPLAHSTQGFQRVPQQQLSHNMVGRPMMHLSAIKQATGEARYMDDIPPYQGELYVGLVLSDHAHARITVDTGPALAMEGVVDYVGVEDVPGTNVVGLGGDMPVFANGEVTSFGQVIGLVVAETQSLAQRAAKAVRVTYENLPSVITIEDAIAANQFYDHVLTITDGDVDTALSAAEHVLEGEVHVGGQDHFYLETIGCLVVPKGEDGEIEIISSTQGATHVQMEAAEVLGVPANRVVSRVKRIGGGFGGKETRTSFLSSAVAVAAHKLNRPMRIMLDRNEDMLTTGGRHPYLGRYRVGFTNEGRVTALDMQLFGNGGISEDLSIAVVLRAVTQCDNVYKIPNFRAVGRVCRTNLPPNTAMRGFGGPQGMIITEQWMQRVAEYLQLPPEKIREMNFYHDGDATPYGQLQPSCHIGRCWTTLMEGSGYQEWRVRVDNFNKCNSWKKRGLAIIPNKYCLAFGVRHLNQGGALLQVYTDGSILLTHGGMEMGQGLHTKMVQVCAHCLDIPVNKVYISETSTSSVPNTSPTAASSSTDLYGMAVKNCCDQLMERLRPFREADPKAGWEEWVKRAYMERVSLSVQGFYKTPDLTFDPSTGKGNLYNYFAYGASASEVEVDTLTGDFTILRSDLVMDVGDSLNPAIDIGQVEGAFTQGMGLFTMEQCVYLEGDSRTQRGQLYTTGPGTYKIPSCSDIPVELNVTLMDKTTNPRAIFSSKAVGEPPFFLAASVFFAIRDAITASRTERGITAPFKLGSPATCEAIRMACSDQFTEQACQGIDGRAKRWTINV